VSAPLRVLVVDDEAPARAALCHLLGRDAEIQVVGVCGDGSAALEALAASAPEIVFLDVRMPGLDGFEVLRAAGACPARVVFVTAHAERAPEAFDVEAIDYVLKPFDDERFARALSRAKAAVRADRTRAGDGGGVAGPRWLERLTVPTVDGVRVLEAGEIDWIEAQDYCVEVHAGGRGYLLRRSRRARAQAPRRDAAQAVPSLPRGAPGDPGWWWVGRRIRPAATRPRPSPAPAGSPPRWSPPPRRRRARGGRGARRRSAAPPPAPGRCRRRAWW